MESFSSTSYSKLDDDRAWSSQEWKTETTTYDGSGRPDKTSWRMVRKVRPDHEEILLDGTAQSVRNGETLRDRLGRLDNINSQEEAGSTNLVMGSDAAKFVNKVKDHVRKRQKRMSNVAESGEEHPIIWWMFMAATLNAATFMGKNFSTIQSFIKNYEDLTLKQMFDVTALLVNDQEEIHGLDKIHWRKNSWRQLSLIGDETVYQSSAHKSLRLFRFCIVSWEDPSTSRFQPSLEEQNCRGQIREKLQRLYDGINGEPTEFEWNIFPVFTTLQLCGKINDLLSRLGERPENFHRKKSIYVDVQ